MHESLNSVDAIAVGVAAGGAGVADVVAVAANDVWIALPSEMHSLCEIVVVIPSMNSTLYCHRFVGVAVVCYCSVAVVVANRMAS